jgi:hypothetical protein
MTRCTLLALLSIGLLGCDTVGVKDAYTALDGRGDRKRDVFYTDTKAIYCVLEMASGVADVTVTARLRANALYDERTGEAHAVDTIVGIEEQAPGAGENQVVSFRIQKPQGLDVYPAGDFTCELLIDGELEAELDFEVQYPDCPFLPIEAQSSCAQVVLRGVECPAPFGGACVCEPDAGVWECE